MEKWSNNKRLVAPSHSIICAWTFESSSSLSYDNNSMSSSFTTVFPVSKSMSALTKNIFISSLYTENSYDLRSTSSKF